MLVHVEITAGFDPEIEGAVTGYEIEHVIQETDPGPILESPFAVERNRHLDRGFGRLPVD
jgi:hypothetical protein